MNVRAQRGFTLVEMIIVIVITGIIAGMVAIFIRAPVQGYVDSARRADMSDMADTALRRMARDMRTAVPNSVRLPVPAGSLYIEFLPTSDGGRYRVNATGGGAGCNAVGGNVDGAAFAFGTTDTCFGIIGAPMDFSSGDAIVIGSTQSTGNLPYLAINNPLSVRRMIPLAGAGTGRTTVQITSGVNFPIWAEQDGHRFYVVPANQWAVTYACEGVGVAGGDGTGRLTRYSGYGFRDPQLSPMAIAAMGFPGAILAEGISGCNLVYDPTSQRDSLVAVNLTITRGGDSVNLYHEIHVNNIP